MGVQTQTNGGLSSIWDYFVGKKAYIVCVAMIIYAALGWLLKYMSEVEAIQIILNALALIGIRLGIAGR